MIPRLQSAGGSFLGAGKYYLHDKLAEQQAEAARDGVRVSTRGQSDERVWFTDTRNCLNIDPERALEEMWHTAENQAWLKQQAGVKRGGRSCEDPVKTLSLAWHKDDKPIPEHMVEAADSFLKHMGWDQHQAVYVGHQDTEHRHIHIILNRVHPETGCTLNDYRDQVRAQEWALAYEKEHQQVRCEMREVNAAKRDGRTVGAEREVTGVQPPQPAPREVANDHLPHNVIKIARPNEKLFEADEKARADRDLAERAHLKAEQRAEREAFFKDGAKLFKATRHAVYDQVRKEYAPEWRAFYKDVKDAGRTADAASENALSRTVYFAGQGKWDEAREAFGDRDSVRDAVSAELAERKADLKARQHEDLRERQNDACEALRDVRDAQYQDLLQRQRDERAAFNAGQTLDSIRLDQTKDERANGPAIEGYSAPANENRIAEGQVPPVLDVQHAPDLPRENAPTITIGEQRPVDAATAISEPGSATPEVEPHAPEPANVVSPTLEAPEPTRQVADLAAGVIGSLASYVADQLGEMFAPTPPEVREAQAKAAAKAEAERPAPVEPENPYARQIEAAMRLVEAEREERERNRAYWEERDKGKDFERDR
jgi:hypothetical protein